MISRDIAAHNGDPQLPRRLSQSPIATPVLGKAEPEPLILAVVGQMVFASWRDVTIGPWLVIDAKADGLIHSAPLR